MEEDKTFYPLVFRDEKFNAGAIRQSAETLQQFALL